MGGPNVDAGIAQRLTSQGSLTVRVVTSNLRTHQVAVTPCRCRAVPCTNLPPSRVTGGMKGACSQPQSYNMGTTALCTFLLKERITKYCWRVLLDSQKTIYGVHRHLSPIIAERSVVPPTIR